MNHVQRSHQAKLLSSTKSKTASYCLIIKYGVKERSTCDLVGFSRNAWRCIPISRNDEALLEAEVIRLAGLYGRYGYRIVAGLML